MTRRGSAGQPGVPPSRLSKSQAHWTTLYPRTGLRGWPPLAIVLTGAGPTALDNRIRTVAGLSREHWAPQRRTGYGLADRAGDFYLDFTGRIPLVMTTQARLQQYGPLGPVRFRIDGYHPAEGEPLLQALADIRTEADFDHRQEQRGHAAKAAEAAEQRREEAEKRRRDVEWAREEWFEKWERKMKKLARQWDEAATADDR
jgi:hypothetical protein